MPELRTDSVQAVRPRDPTRDDELIRTITSSGSIAVKALMANEIVAEAVSLRPHAATAGNALGRAMMGALLIAVGSAADDADEANVESVQLQIRGDGPLGSVTAIADSRARVRGCVQRPGTELLHEDGSPNLARAVGLGPLNVVRHRPRWRSPYTGTVPLVSGEIARDLTLYLTESEQTPSAMGLGVCFGANMADVAAAGFLIQALPGATDADLEQMEQNVARLPGLATLLDQSIDAQGILDRLVEGLGSRERHALRPEFFCPCSRDRAARTLSLLDRAELEQLIEVAASQEVICDFCGQDYQITSDEIASLLASEGSTHR